MKLHRPRTYLRIVKRYIYGPTIAERAVFNTMKRIHGNVFVDVGANIGMYSIPLSNHFQTVYSFEPDDRAARIFREKSWGIPNIHIFNYALSDKDGEAHLYRDPLYPTPDPPTGSASTILDEWHYKPACLPHVDILYHGKTFSTVKTSTLDSFFESFLKGIKWIDLVKIDVEGAEFLVLEGAKNLLKDGRITRLIVELHDRDRRLALIGLFANYGYRGRWIDSDHYYAQYWPRTRTAEQAFVDSREPVSHSAYQ